MTPTASRLMWLPSLIAALATWRLSHLFMYEAGPWGSVQKLRAYFGVRHDPDGTPVAWPDGSVFECFLCFSVWVGLLSAASPSWLLRPFALSACAILVNKWYNNVKS